MLQYIELGSSAILEPARYGLAALERLRYGRGLFDESKFTRDEDGQFASKGGGGSHAAIADEPFGLTSGPKPKARTGKGASSDAQGSLFDKDLHGQEARDLPGQKNFLGGDAPKAGTPGPAHDMGGWGYGSTNIAITPKRQALLEKLKAANKHLGSGGGKWLASVVDAFDGDEAKATKYVRMQSGGSDILASAAHADGWHSNAAGDEKSDLMSGIDKSDAPSRKPAEESPAQYPHEMTIAEYKERRGDNPKALAFHKSEVRKALASGKNVPPKVLADYPDLAKRR